MKVLVTGAAGFIGFHICQRLLSEGYEITGIDNLNEYYDVSLKEARLNRLINEKNFRFEKLDIINQEGIENAFRNFNPQRVIHLAAQAGVRYSLKNPHAYIASNIVGFTNILESCRHNNIEHLVYASSSSVYGANTSMPFSVHDNVDHPLSLYGATKKANELMAHTYSHLYDLPTTGLRFFTVYGPWGRPDMALFIFTRKILEGKPIDVFNQGKHKRDFTYIDDVVTGVVRVMKKIPEPNSDWSSDKPDPGTSNGPYRIYNIGNHSPVELMRFIEILEKRLGKIADKNYLPMQPGDVPETYADVDDLINDVDYSPSTPIEKGISEFVEWYKQYYKVT